MGFQAATNHRAPAPPQNYAIIAPVTLFRLPHQPHPRQPETFANRSTTHGAAASFQPIKSY
ncbi:hypothetical protein GCWU000324_02393 [Kingella oralis ATCC 51147]|uniref:Uncharacterized protein n=1 Tax=Kingella oralis ATCC 51147 TaxID=629741 RepID=C4GK19_9NEIS|nr:hypothetical protein GCWU000324_02393 [Kingella oralis ATCC 51147]